MASKDLKDLQDLAAVANAMTQAVEVNGHALYRVRVYGANVTDLVYDLAPCFFVPDHRAVSTLIRNPSPRVRELLTGLDGSSTVSKSWPGIDGRKPDPTAEALAQVTEALKGLVAEIQDLRTVVERTKPKRDNVVTEFTIGSFTRCAFPPSDPYKGCEDHLK